MPDPTLQTTALRYAAGDLSAEEATAFEALLAENQDARDALAEAVRLSAQAIGQQAPAPHPSFRAAIRARLNARTHRGHPLTWASLGAAAVAACTFIGLALASRMEPETAHSTPDTPAADEESNTPHAQTLTPFPAPLPRNPGTTVAAETSVGDGDSQRSVAEIWADLSNPESIEKARDDEFRWRQHIRDVNNPHHISASVKSAAIDVRNP